MILLIVPGLFGLVLWLTIALARHLNSKTCPHCLSRIPKDAAVCARCCRDIEEEPAEIQKGDDPQTIALIKALERRNP